MKHSKTCMIWLENINRSDEFIKNYIENKMEINLFLPNDIIALLNILEYEEFIEQEIIKKIEYINSFRIDEVISLIYIGKKDINNKIFLYFIKNYKKKKDILIKLKKEIPQYFSEFTTEIIEEKLKNNETNFTEFLNPYLLGKFLVQEKENRYYHLIINETLNSKKQIQQLICNLNLFDEFTTREVLRIISSSLYLNKEKNYINIIKGLIKCYYFQVALKNKSQKDLVKTVCLIIEDTVKLAKKELYDIEYFNRGSYCSVYKVGDYLIKLGRKRICNTIENDENLLHPICRKYIEELDLFIEVTLLENNEEITDEDVYKVYKNVRDNKRIWLDAKKENLVKLKKDNNNFPFEIEAETLGFVGKTKKFRKKGEYAISDTDLLFKEENIPWNEIETECSSIVIKNYRKLEKRYQQEKRSLI